MSNKYIYDTPLEISSEQWLEMLQNDEVFNDQDRNMILAVLQYDGQPHATPIAHAIGLKGRGAINLQVDRLGKKIMKRLPEVLYPKQDNGSDRPWHIPFLGEEDRVSNHFLWTLRPALKEAAEIYFAKELKAEKEMLSEQAYSKIKKQLLNGSYIDISYRRYKKFKENELYDESYKLEILSRLNEFLRGQEINEMTVLDIVKKLQKENPSAGSFVHWSNTADLVKFTEARPEEVSLLLNKLYNSDAPINERIENFRGKAKVFNPDISLGAPLFGYLLAAKDYTKYPIYKQEVFTKIKNDYAIEQKLGAVGQNYEVYLFICDFVLSHFKRKDSSLTILDIQDFFYCSTTYNQIIVESAVDYIFEQAVILREFEENQEQMLNVITNIDPKILEQLRNQYRNSEKINLIRYKLIEEILENGSASLSNLNTIKEEIRVKYDTNILNSWSNFSILFQLYYFDKKKKVQDELGKIHQAIRRFEELKDRKFVENKVLNGFSWNNQFGTSRCWLAVYEVEYPNHRPAPQLFVAIDSEGIEYGLHFGDQHAQSGRRSVAHIKKAQEFSYEDFYRKIIEVIGEFDDDSLVVEPVIPYTKELGKETWLELIANKDIFHEKDLVYLYKMYEMGGQASTIQLAEALGKSRSSFNTPVVQLAKRIQQETGIEDMHRDDGSICYWCVLFEGEYGENDQFFWRLKPNLKEALSESYNDPTSVKYESYSKEDFLSEVFIDDKKYDEITRLLKYKKNIILQGPPGVGKTFVSKRLAYSLMGSKDESRVEMIQFHQNYSYEDFVMGFRPQENGFSLQFGVFYDFCQLAIDNPEENYYFIIDEINRGNLSKIFGELFMLIESDKRDEFVTMGYSKDKFTVPANLHLIGTMNTADRSLAQIEVALRRRFAFVTLTPTFNEKWRLNLMKSNVSAEMANQIHQIVDRLNSEIVNDYQLGSGYAIGHSFFSAKPESIEEKVWLEGIMDFEIIPLLEEYYFDRPEEVEKLLEEL